MKKVGPDFGSILTEQVVLPYREEPYLKMTFDDPVLAGHVLIIIEDSLPDGSDATPENGYQGQRLTTFASTFPRPILAEANTHRVWSRNSASSRARSVKSTIDAVMEKPYIPVFTRNKKGMSGEWGTRSDQRKVEAAYLRGRDRAVITVLELILGEKKTAHLTIENVRDHYPALLEEYNQAYLSGEDEAYLSSHKQIFNRVLEPYQWHEAIVTSSYWGNFINLRNHQDADPAIHGPAALMDHYLQAYAPAEKWYHLPFLSEQEIPLLSSSWGEMKPALMKSSGEAAQISYHDKTTATKATATSNLGDRLLSSGHFSPFEHPAVTREAYFDVVCHLDDYLPKDPKSVASNFDESWVQFRPMVAGITK